MFCRLIISISDRKKSACSVSVPHKCENNQTVIAFCSKEEKKENEKICRGKIF